MIHYKLKLGKRDYVLSVRYHIKLKGWISLFRFNRINVFWWEKCKGTVLNYFLNNSIVPLFVLLRKIYHFASFLHFNCITLEIFLTFFYWCQMIQTIMFRFWFMFIFLIIFKLKRSKSTFSILKMMFDFFKFKYYKNKKSNHKLKLLFVISKLKQSQNSIQCITNNLWLL